MTFKFEPNKSIKCANSIKMQCFSQMHLTSIEKTILHIQVRTEVTEISVLRFSSGLSKP